MNRKEFDEMRLEFGEYVFENIFVHYTAKQWNTSIDNVDKSVINRVPVLLGYDDRYFQDKYQFMPKKGYNEIFENMLNNKNITKVLDTDAKTLIKVDTNNELAMDSTDFPGLTVNSLAKGYKELERITLGALNTYVK